MRQWIAAGLAVGAAALSAGLVGGCTSVGEATTRVQIEPGFQANLKIQGDMRLTNQSGVPVRVMTNDTAEGPFDRELEPGETFRLDANSPMRLRLTGPANNQVTLQLAIADLADSAFELKYVPVAAPAE